MSGFLEYIQHNAALAGSGEKNLIDELLACVLKERVEGADDIAARGHHSCEEAPGNSIKPLNV